MMEKRTRNYIFWDDIEKYRERLKWIFDLLDDLDKERPTSFNLSENLFIMPHDNHKCKHDREFQELFNTNPELFYVQPRKYGLKSNRYDSMVGTGKEIVVFDREELFEYNLYSDYLTQVLLLALLDFYEVKNEKGQE